MRVIGGKYKGKRLSAPDGERVRPTTDRIKETMFNILFSRGAVGEIEALDLFAGSGALGIEAMSRGATKVVIVDSSPDSIRLIKSNLALVKADPSAYELYCADFAVAIKKLRGRRFDAIFADPPYAAGYERAILDGIAENDLLSPRGTLVMEHASDNAFDTSGYKADRRKCGNTSLTFLSRDAEESNTEANNND